jgi:hypothetical protein
MPCRSTMCYFYFQDSLQASYFLASAAGGHRASWHSIYIGNSATGDHSTLQCFQGLLRALSDRQSSRGAEQARTAVYDLNCCT